MKHMSLYRCVLSITVILSLIWALQLQAAPLSMGNHASSDSKYSISKTDDGPGSIEQRGRPYVKSRKKSPLIPIVIGVVAIGAIAAVLILVVFKNKYNIVGTWDVAYKWSDMTTPQHFTNIFKGNAKSGPFEYRYSGHTGSGNYTVDKKNVRWTYNDGDAIYTGVFTDTKTMSGTMMNDAGSSWTATKVNNNTTALNGIASSGPIQGNHSPARTLKK